MNSITENVIYLAVDVVVAIYALSMIGQSIIETRNIKSTYSDQEDIRTYVQEMAYDNTIVNPQDVVALMVNLKGANIIKVDFNNIDVPEGQPNVEYCYIIKKDIVRIDENSQQIIIPTVKKDYTKITMNEYIGNDYRYKANIVRDTHGDILYYSFKRIKEEVAVDDGKVINNSVIGVGLDFGKRAGYGKTGEDSTYIEFSDSIVENYEGCEVEIEVDFDVFGNNKCRPADANYTGCPDYGAPFNGDMSCTAHITDLTDGVSTQLRCSGSRNIIYDGGSAGGLGKFITKLQKKIYFSAKALNEIDNNICIALNIKNIRIITKGD